MNKEKLQQFLGKNLQVLVIFGGLLLVIVIGGIITPQFFNINHIINILYLNSILGILAISQTLVIITGGIDMSVGATYWLVIMLGAQFMKGEFLWGPILICLLIGVSIGFINGFCIAKLKIPFVVMTLAMMVIITGVLYVTTGGGGGGKSAEALTRLSIQRILLFGSFRGIPVRFLIWVFIAIIFALILNRTSLGWKIRALGSNMQASILSGINTESIQIFVYTISGLLAVIAGLLYLGQAKTPYPTFQSGAGVGGSITLQTIATVVLGGTFFYGGNGGVGRTFLGVVFISILYSILNMVGLHEEWQVIFNGLIILIIVGLYSKMKSRT
ncbi:MAG: ABC transporter permease [Actinomycetota bacterium]